MGDDGSDQPSTSQEASAIVFNRKRARNIRSKSASTAAEEHEEDEDLKLGRKQRQSRGAIAFTTKQDDAAQDMVRLAYAGGDVAHTSNDGGATRHLETETEFDRDARARREKVLQQAGEDGSAAGDVYRGMTGYTDFRKGFRRENTIAAEKGGGSHGPIRASPFIRMTVQVDYKPDLCKDYKETGYCSYGDACKFLHDRGDYKAGWELDKMWEEQQKAKQARLMAGQPDADNDDEDDNARDDDDEDDDDLPFACGICKRRWGECKDPVVTPCRHYFCEHCALRHNAKTAKCFICEQPTQGLFNVATDIVKKMKQSK